MTFFHKECDELEYKLYSEEDSCGIEVLRRGQRVRVIPDIGEKEKLNELVALLNELGADEEQLDYIIEDHLTFFSR